MTKEEIRALFATHSVALTQNDVWAVQGTPVIKHSALERLSAALKLTWDMPVVVRNERDECVVLVRATRQDGVSEWSFGEALIAKDGAGGNYKVSGKQASYVYAMGEKRGKDRVIIKLAGLHGAYSNEEADDFNDATKRDRDDEPAPAAKGKAAPAEKPTPAAEPESRDMELVALEVRLKEAIDGKESVNAVTDMMLDNRTVEALKSFPKEKAEEIRDYAKARLVALGWPGAKGRGQSRPRLAA